MKLKFPKYAMLIGIGCLTVVIVVRGKQTNVNSSPENGSAGAASKILGSMSDEDRLKWLEKNREMPEVGFQNSDAIHNWKLAEQTTWWGKRLDPEVFWSNRVVWNDKSAEDAAQRHGRGYPPMPFDDKTLHNSSDDWVLVLDDAEKKYAPPGLRTFGE